MTDQPDGGHKPGSGAPDVDLSADQDATAEPGLVVEDDVELDLGESEDVASVGAPPAEPEGVREQHSKSEGEGSESEGTVESEATDREVDAANAELDESEADAAVVDVPVADAEPVASQTDAAEVDQHFVEASSGTEPPPPEDEDPAKKTHWGRRAVLGLVAVAAALYVAGYFLTGSRLPAQASIGPVDVGGMSPAAARSAVDKALTPRAADPLVLTYGGYRFRIAPADAGLALDLDETIDKAGGARSWKPADMVGLFFGKHQTAPQLDVDDSKLRSVISTIGERVNKDVVEPQITFPHGKPLARAPRPGLVVSRGETASAIRDAYIVRKTPIKVPTTVVEPKVDAEALAAEMTAFAKPAVSGPVTIAAGGKRVSLPVTAFAPALVVRVERDKLTPYIDPKKLAGPLTSSTTGIGQKAVDATVRIQNDKPVVSPSKAGLGLQPAEMARKLLPVLAMTGPDRKVTVTAKVVEPRFSTADAKALKITEKISGFVTQFPYAEYRNINQSRAANIINGTILKPGETFSFNGTVGERTGANGFVKGFIINKGVFREELGGGVSQVATTAYNAGFFGGMDDVEHHPHAFYISRYPVGREATVYYGALDLRFRNSTKYGVLIRSYVVKSTPSSPGQMHVELWSTRVWDIKAGLSAKRNLRKPGTVYDDTDKCVPQDPVQGFDVDVYRYFYRGGKKVRTETDTANYQAADHVICGKDPQTN